MLSTTTQKMRYTGGTSVTLPYTFPITDETHLTVYKTDADGVTTTLVLSTDYTVTGVGVETGGNVVLAAARLTTDIITIIRLLPLLQETEYPANDPFPSSAHESALDRLTMMVQQLDEAITRALRLHVSTSSSVSAELPAPSAGACIGWNSSGTAMVNDPDDLAAAVTAASQAISANDSAQDAKDAAEDAQAAAEAALASVDLPTITAADEGKGLLVDASGNWIKSATVAVLSDITDRIIDEDDMASNSISHMPTQQSTKKYVDDKFCEGLIVGFGHARAGGTSITLSGGRVETGGLVFALGSAVTIATALTGTRWCHLYLSDSLTNPATALTASDFAMSTNVPAWSNTKSGWYYNNQRWLGAVCMTGGAIDAYACYGGLYTFTNPLLMLSTASPASTWAELSLGLPNIGREWSVDLMGQVEGSASDQELRVRSGNSGTTSNGMGVAVTPATSVPADGQIAVLTNNAGAIDYYAGGSTTNVDLYLRRVALPGGCGGM